MKYEVNRSMGQESPERDPHKYSQLIFDKETEEIQWRKDSIKQMVLEQVQIHIKKKKRNLDTDCIPLIKLIYNES